MYINGWMTNVYKDQVERTAKVISDNGGLDLKIDTTGANGPEYTWTNYVDDDDDIVKAMAAIMFYNDRNEEQIASFSKDLEELLKKYERN